MCPELSQHLSLNSDTLRHREYRLSDSNTLIAQYPVRRRVNLFGCCYLCPISTNCLYERARARACACACARLMQVGLTTLKGAWSRGLTARGGHGKTRRGHKVQRGQNLCDPAQLMTPPSFMHMQRIYKFYYFLFLFLFLFLFSNSLNKLINNI
jgi:hypothetical protein